MSSNDCNCNSDHICDCDINKEDTPTAAPWGRSKDAVPSHVTQITIYDEEIGDRIATVFNEPDSHLIQSAPDMLRELSNVLSVKESGGDMSNIDWRSIQEVLDKALRNY